MKLFLHVGLHKTGTTAIQVALSAARERLAQSCGVIYPSAAIPKNHPYGHHQLPWSLIWQEAPKRPDYVEEPSAAWSALLGELDESEGKTVILSSEEFDNLQARHIKKVSRYLSEYEIIPIVYLRKHPALVDSMHRMAVRLGDHRPIEDWAQKSLVRFDFRQLVRDWEDIAWRGQVLAFDYDSVDDVVEHFAKCVGVDNDVLTAAPRKRWNESPGPSEMSPELREWIEARYSDDISFIDSLTR